MDINTQYCYNLSHTYSMHNTLPTAITGMAYRERDRMAARVLIYHLFIIIIMECMLQEYKHKHRAPAVNSRYIW